MSSANAPPRLQPFATVDESRPMNILLLTADDMGGDTPGCFGGPREVTPNLDRLAASGMCFGRAHVAAAVCQPSRSAIMTGRWPHRNGAEGFQPIKAGITVITRLLAAAGYRNGILGKVEHLQPVDAFGWDYIKSMRDLGMGRDPDAYGRAAEEFIGDAVAGDQPWFLMANAHDPHRPFSGSVEELSYFNADERSTYPAPSKVFGAADRVEHAGFLPALAGVIQEHQEYLSSSRRCDDVVGAVLAALDRVGAADDTVVMFLSDNGIAVPFAKANCYLQSTLTPFIVHWPGVTTPGTRDDESLVSMLDLFPTFCQIAGVTVPDDLDGAALRPLVTGDTSGSRQAVFTVFHETAAKARYEMRCRQDTRFGYIWNAWSDRITEYRAENMFGRSWPAMTDAAKTDPTIAHRTDFYRFRTPEELYDLQKDPQSLVNLAHNASHRATLDDSRSALLRWMRDTHDPLTETYARFLDGVDAQRDHPDHEHLQVRTAAREPSRQVTP